ncbi:hypothetical protein ACLQ3B_04835 [Micromonospora sp. DT53]
MQLPESEVEPAAELDDADGVLSRRPTTDPCPDADLDSAETGGEQ